jgi:type II secretory pathway component PulM
MSRETMRRFWYSRTDREQIALTVGATALCLFAFWNALWRPITQENAHLEVQLPRLRAQAVKLEKSGDEIAKLRAQISGTPLDMRQASAILQRSAVAFGLSDGVIGKSTDGISPVPVQFASTSFATWIAWVDNLHRTHKLWLVSCRITALDASGLVRVEAEFGGYNSSAK